MTTGLGMGLGMGKVRRALKRYAVPWLNIAPPTGTFGRTGPQGGKDFQGNLFQAPDGKPVVQGSRMATTVATGALLGPDYVSSIYGSLIGSGIYTLTPSGTGAIFARQVGWGMAYVPSGSSVARRLQFIIETSAGSSTFRLKETTTNKTFATLAPGIKHTLEIDVIALSQPYLEMAANSTSMEITFLSVREVLPTACDDLADGTPLHPWSIINTPNGPVKSYNQYPRVQRDTDYRLGSRVSMPVAGGSTHWYECTTAGKSHASVVPTYTATGYVVDGGVTFTRRGYHCLEGVSIEPGATNTVVYPNDPSQWSTTGATKTDLENTNGMFKRVSVESQGATWHRALARNGINIPAGTVYAVRFFYEAGTSGRVHLEARDDSNSISSYIEGDIGNPLVTSQTAGTFSNLRTVLLGSGIWMTEFLFTKATSAATCSFGIGPFTTAVGSTIIALGCDVIQGNDLGGSHIFGTPGASSSRAAPNLGLDILEESKNYIVVVMGTIPPNGTTAEKVLFTIRKDATNHLAYKRSGGNTGWDLQHYVDGVGAWFGSKASSYTPGERFCCVLRVSSSLGLAHFSKGGAWKDPAKTSIAAANSLLVGRGPYDTYYFGSPLDIIVIVKNVDDATCQRIANFELDPSEVR